MAKGPEGITPLNEVVEHIPEFLKELRLAGYYVGTQEYLKVYEFLIKLSASGRFPEDPHKLHTMLAPIVCNTAREQEDFKDRFDYWIGRFRKAETFSEKLSRVESKDSEKIEETKAVLDDINKSKKKWITWILAALFLVLAVASFALFFNIEPGVTPAPVKPVPDKIADKNIPASIDAPDRGYYLLIIALALLGTGIAVQQLWWKKQARLFFSRRQTRDIVQTQSFFVQGLKDPLFRTVSFFRMAQELRKRVPSDTPVLDMDATVEETIKGGGIFTPVETFGKALPEYLFLVDKATFLDHQSRYVDSVVDKLVENEVLVHVYYYDEDPRSCIPQKDEGYALDLKQLAGRHFGHRLVMFGNTSNFINDFSGEISTWLDYFTIWQDRAVFTFESKNERDYGEQRLSQYGFQVYQANQTGLAAYIEKMNDRPMRTGLPEKDEHGLPDMVEEFSSLWIERRAPEAENIGRLVEEVRTYLRPDGFDWLCACAVYPEIDWHLTLYIGDNLTGRDGQKLLNEPDLASLSRLPWFRCGYMPDWLRNCLISELTLKKDMEIRQALNNLLITAADQPLEGIRLEYSTMHENVMRKLSSEIAKMLSIKAPKDSPLRDHIFVTFMSNKLSVQIPRQLNKVFRTALKVGPRPARRLQRFADIRKVDERVFKKYDKLNKAEKLIFDVLSVCLVLFYSYSAVLQPVSTQYHRGIYVIITYILVFLIYKSKSRIMRAVDYMLILLSIFSIGYWILNFEAINYRTGAETPFDMAVAVVGVLIGIELARRVVGNVFVILGGLLLLYGVYGDYMPDLIAHTGTTFPGLCTSIFYKSDGVFGIMANVLATYVILFVLFGAFLEKSGAQKFFIDFPLAAVGHRMGGPAKVAVIASGLFGSISGSAIANVVSTGTFTIPMMKKAGFRPHIAGGIEPAASISGMFMPPIMGAGGFIMAELTGVPYSKIMLVAIFPAIMYVFSVFIMVHYEAKLHDIKGEKSEHSAMEILKTQWYYIMPLVVITILMLYDFSPGYSAILGIVTCLIISWFRTDTRITPKRFIEASRAGAENSLKIGATVGVIGIIIGVLTYSGLVLTFADIVIELASGAVFFGIDFRLVATIFLIALASLVLGMGVPVTAAYLITAVVAVPALIHLGVNEIAAHMIVYWLSQDSNITPPVCIAAFEGASIAKANMWRTAFAAFKFAKFLYLGPFLFGYVPGFSLNGTGWDIIKAFVLILFGTYAYSWLLSGIWMNYFKKDSKKSPAN